MLVSTVASSTGHYPDQTRHSQSSLSQLPSSRESSTLFKDMFQSLLTQLFPCQGLMLLDHTGKLLQLNSKAIALCQMIESLSTPEADQAHDTTDKDSRGSKDMDIALFGPLSQNISNLCELLIDSQQQFPNQSIQLYEDVAISHEINIRITGKPFGPSEQQEPCFLIQLEDLAETASQQAKYDAYRYGFTPRETEVWALCLQNMQRRDIAQKLFIELCTVKKHIKNINRKRNGEA